MLVIDWHGGPAMRSCGSPRPGAVARSAVRMPRRPATASPAMSGSRAPTPNSCRDHARGEGGESHTDDARACARRVPCRKARERRLGAYLPASLVDSRVLSIGCQTLGSAADWPMRTAVREFAFLLRKSAIGAPGRTRTCGPRLRRLNSREEVAASQQVVRGAMPRCFRTAGSVSSSPRCRRDVAFRQSAGRNPGRESALGCRRWPERAIAPPPRRAPPTQP